MKRFPNPLVLISALFLAGSLIYAAIPPGDGRPSSLSILFDSLKNSAAAKGEIYKGYRSFEGSMKFGRLTFHGGAVTFLKATDPTSFVPYNFSFNRGEFIKMPRDHGLDRLHKRIKIELPTQSGVMTQSCIDPQAGVASDAKTYKYAVLCRVKAALEGHQDAMIGVLIPKPDDLPLADGDMTCRTEVRNWVKNTGFSDVNLVLCAIVDQRPDADAYSAEDWMDVIFYQRFGRDLLNMRAARRNFQRIK